MQIRIKDIPVEGQTVTVDIPLTKGRTTMDGRLCGQIGLRVMADEVVAEVRAAVEARSTCSRCLEEFENGFKIDVVLACVPASSLTEDDKQLSGDELDLYFYEDGLLDINRMMEEQVILNIPMQTMCSSDCKGLCPACGENLNIGHCKCVKRPSDERFYALKALINGARAANKTKGA
ncbi:MAG: DUF177 domain-containing protein [Candidatus Magnetominusculus sp. LBB02]|nr:DUF177 domain-containing protein [Candidatus Magnetominusculus sp. LBB02]